MLDKPVILFDGDCNLCNWSVQFIIKRDPTAIFRFASLQSSAGQQLLQRPGNSFQNIDSVVLVEGQSYFIKSDAALRVTRNLSGAWPLLRILGVFPRGLRDQVYDLIARNRYKWFGKQNYCMMPTPELLARFLK